MIILIAFAFLAGIVTILSPCILPILPILLSTSVGGGRKRPLGVVVGFVVSFTFFTLMLTTIVKLFGLPPATLRFVAVGVIFLFGLVMIVPKLQLLWEQVAAQLAPKGSGPVREGFWGGVLVGLSLGLLWTPCVGPIMAAVITLAATGSVSGSSVLLTLAYSLGTAVPMLAVLYGGRLATMALPTLRARTHAIQRVFGGLMIVVALGMFFNLDRNFQTWILTTFPQYGTGLTKLEEVPLVRDRLQTLQKQPPNPVMQEVTEQLGQLFDYGEAADFTGGTNWLNSPPLSMANLRGKVVLVDFWTYSCVNCIRTLPYITAWDQKYREHGLVVVGVHSPEFAFEKETKNVDMALKDFKIEYPVVQDNDFVIWRAYHNQYWPAKYLIDKNGRVRYVHFGEGEYDKTEMMIQKLLNEVAPLPETSLVTTKPYIAETTSPETYVGYWRIERLVSPEGVRKDAPTSYTIPAQLSVHDMALGGNWTIRTQFAAAGRGAKLAFLFAGKQVNLVMRPIGSTPAKARVWLDGQLVRDPIAGTDVIDGLVTVNAARLYHLVQLSMPERHTLVIEFLDDNAEVYAFTFG